jgi:hypothetical protein
VRPSGRVVIILFAVACLAACTEVVDSVVDTRYAQYNRSTDWAKNEAILLNIVRASEYQPLNFLSFQPYTGSASVTGTAAAPSFIIGPDRVNSQKQYTIGSSTLSASATGSGTINVTNLDTSDFYDSLLSPVDFVNLNAFQHQGYPRELLFRLFADYVSLKPQAGSPNTLDSAIVYNDPSEVKSCFPLSPPTIKRLYGAAATDSQRRICFKDLVVFALVSGLSSEIRTVAPAASTTKSTTGGGGGGGNQNQTQNSNTPKPQTEGRLCFDPALASRAIWEFTNLGWADRIPPLPDLMATQYHPICGGTGPLDIWPPTSQKPAAAPTSAADSAKKAADATTKAAAADAAATAAPGDATKAAAATAAKAAADTANATAAATKKTAAASAAPPSTSRKARCLDAKCPCDESERLPDMGHPPSGTARDRDRYALHFLNV